MTRTHWDGTPLDIDEVPMLTSGVLEVGSRDGMVTVQQAGPRGGLGPVYQLSPDQARTLAVVLTKRAARVGRKGRQP